MKSLISHPSRGSKPHPGNVQKCYRNIGAALRWHDPPVYDIKMDHQLKASVNSPSRHISLGSYHAECVFAIEPSFNRLVTEAEKAGWDRKQVLLAIIALSLGNSKQEAGLTALLRADDS